MRVVGCRTRNVDAVPSNFSNCICLVGAKSSTLVETVRHRVTIKLERRVPLLSQGVTATG